MKKVLFVSFVALAAAACSSNLEIVDTPAQPLIFQASIEDANDSKALIEGLKTYWQLHDTISVSPLIQGVATPVAKAYYLVTQSAGATTTLEGNITDKDTISTYFAVYPKSGLTSWNTKAKSDYVNAATVQGKTLFPNGSSNSSTHQHPQKVNTVGGVDIYCDPRTVALVAKATKKDPTFHFRHGMAYIKFTVPDDANLNIKLIQLNDSKYEGTDPAKEFKSPLHQIAGSYAFSGTENFKFGYMGAKNTLTYQFNPSQSFPAGVYYITIFPRDFSGADEIKNYKNFTFLFQNTKDKKVYKPIGDGETSIPIKAGTVYDLGTIPTNLFQ